MFGCLPLPNAIDVLVNVPSRTIVLNNSYRVRRNIQRLKTNLAANQLSIPTSGEDLVLLNELVALHCGLDPQFNSVRAVLPMPLFEVKGVKNSFDCQILEGNEGIWVGFCDQQFPLEGNRLGRAHNSIGIGGKGSIWVDGTDIDFKNESDEILGEGDAIEMGIIHQPNSGMNCYVAVNGHLLGRVALPPKFATIQLFPAATLWAPGNLVRFDFANNELSAEENAANLQQQTGAV